MSYKASEYDLEKMKAIRNYVNSDNCDYTMTIGGVGMEGFLCEDLSEYIERSIVPRLKEDLYGMGFTDIDIFDKKEEFAKVLPYIGQAIIDRETTDNEAKMVLAMYYRYNLYELSYFGDITYITNVNYSLIDQVQEMGYKKLTDTTEYTVRQRHNAIKLMDKLILKEELDLDFLQAIIDNKRKGL